MSDNNGTRLDHIERLLIRMIEHHEAEFKAMRTWQVLTQGHMDDLRDMMKQQAVRFEEQGKRFDEQGERFNQFLKKEDERGERIDNLVIAIGKLIQRLPEVKA